MGRSFLRGAAWLAVGSLVSKLLGAVYRVFLPRVLGDAGVGLFQMAYPLYAVVLTLSVTGIPLALSKLTAEWRTVGRDQDADQLADWALVGLALLGIGLAAGMALASAWLARAVFHEPRAALPMLALSPALALVALEAGWRGYFQGRQRMRPTAISQILEQGVRVLVMFPLAMALLSRGLSAAVAGAVAGAPIGAAVGVWYLAQARRQHGPLWPVLPVPWRGLGRLAVLAAPMAMTALLFPVLLLTDAVVVPDNFMDAIGWKMCEYAQMADDSAQSADQRNYAGQKAEMEIRYLRTWKRQYSLDDGQIYPATDRSNYRFGLNRYYGEEGGSAW